MGVTIDKARASTVVKGVFIKSVSIGGAASKAESPSGGLRPGDEVLAVNGEFLRGLDQNDVIKILKDIPSVTLLQVLRAEQKLETKTRFGDKTKQISRSLTSLTREETEGEGVNGSKFHSYYENVKSKKEATSSEYEDVPDGYAKLVITLSKPANASLGLSLIPSSGRLKGYFQVSSFFAQHFLLNDQSVWHTMVGHLPLNKKIKDSLCSVFQKK